MQLIVYEVGFGRQYSLVDGKRIRNPGWDLAEARRHLGGESGVLRDPHGCASEFSLEPWRGFRPTSWKVVPQFVQGGANPDDYRGAKLAEARRRLGGDSGTIADPTGRLHVVDLTRFVQADEARTRIDLTFTDSTSVSLVHRLFWRLAVNAGEDRRRRDNDAANLVQKGAHIANDGA